MEHEKTVFGKHRPTDPNTTALERTVEVLTGQVAEHRDLPTRLQAREGHLRLGRGSPAARRGDR